MKNELAKATADFEKSKHRLAHTEWVYHSVKSSRLFSLQKWLMQMAQNPKAILKTSNARKQEARKKIDKLTEKLYKYGFVERSLKDLEDIHEKTADKYLREYAALELAKWYTNQGYPAAASIALDFIEGINKDEAKQLKNQCLAILEGESFNQQAVESTLNLEHFDIIIASDFTKPNDVVLEEIKIHQQAGLKTALIQMHHYQKPGQPNVKIDGVSFLQADSQATCDLLLVRQPSTLKEKQVNLPSVQAHNVYVIIDEKTAIGKLQRCRKHLYEYTGLYGKWFPASDDIRAELLKNKEDLRYIKLARENWLNLTSIEDNKKYNEHISRIADCFVDRDLMEAK